MSRVTDHQPFLKVELTGNETMQELRQRGLPESTAHAARKRGYYCPGYAKRDYPQKAGMGGFAELYDARGLIINTIKREVHRHHTMLDPETFRDWTQDLLLECWKRRHATHIHGSFVPYYLVMIRGLVRQWLRRHLNLAELHVCLAEDDWRSGGVAEEQTPYTPLMGRRLHGRALRRNASAMQRARYVAESIALRQDEGMSWDWSIYGLQDNPTQRQRVLEVLEDL